MREIEEYKDMLELLENKGKEIKNIFDILYTIVEMSVYYKSREEELIKELREQEEEIEKLKKDYKNQCEANAILIKKFGDENVRDI